MNMSRAEYINPGRVQWVGKRARTIFGEPAFVDNSIKSKKKKKVSNIE